MLKNLSTILVSVFVCGLLIGATPVAAQDPIHKAGRGIVNVFTGWIEIPKNTTRGWYNRDDFKEENAIFQTAKGFTTGLGIAVLRMGIGFYEAVTFPFPYPKRYASPYEGMGYPEYAWE